jgi:LEA14-like dessication related protein
MFLSRRRIILIVAIAAILSAIILLPLILATFSAPDINSITIELSKIEVKNITNNNNKSIPLDVFFNIHNPTDKAVTTSKIEYDLIADGKPLGQGVLSYEDIPLNGRPQLLPGLTTTLQSTFELNQSNMNSDIFRVIKNAEAAKQIKWKVEGVAQIESAFSFSPKQFSDELNK